MRLDVPSQEHKLLVAVGVYDCVQLYYAWTDSPKGLAVHRLCLLRIMSPETVYAAERP